MASVPSINAAFDNLSTETINQWMASTYADAYTGHHPLWMRLLQKGNIVKGGAGYAWNEPFKYPTLVGPAVAGVSNGYAGIADATETGGKTMAVFVPAQFAMQVAVENYDLNAQGSDTEKINHIQSTMEISRDKYFEFFAAALWAAEGTAGSGGESRNVMGSLLTYFNGGGAASGATPAPKAAQLTAAVGTSPLTQVGGVQRTNAGGAYWCPNLYNPTNPDAPSLTLMNKLYTTCTRGSDHPDLIILPENLYNFYMTVLQGQQRTDNSDTALANVGFEAYRWRGADVIFDDGCPSTTNANQAFVINTKYLRLRYLSMKPTFELAPIYNKLVRNWMSSITLQLTADNLGRVHARHAKIADPT